MLKASSITSHFIIFTTSSLLEPATPQGRVPTTHRCTTHFFSPAALMFLAAFRSLSCFVPQALQVHSRSLSVSASLIEPQFEHVLLLGSKRSITIRFFPYNLHLYFICLKNSAKDASAIDRDISLLPSMAATFRFSITKLSVWLSRISSVVTC